MGRHHVAITWACVAEAQGAGELMVESRSGGQQVSLSISTCSQLSALDS